MQNVAPKVIFCALLVLPPSLMAQNTVYTYTGHTFTDFFGSPGVDTTDSVGGSFTVSSPLAPNLPFTDITALILTANLFVTGTHPQTIAPPFTVFPAQVSTDSAGNILQWSFGIFSTNYQSPFNIQVWNIDGGVIGDYFFYDPNGFNQAHDTTAGTWSNTSTCAPVRPVAKDIIQDYGNIPSWSKGLPHNGIDYRSPLSNGIVSVGPNGVIHQFTKPDARRFGSINPDGEGPAIWVKHTLQDGTPIYVLYGHTATAWLDNSTGTGKTFNFDATYTLQWSRGNTIGANTMMGNTAPFYNGGVSQPHLHVSIFKPKKVCKNNAEFCGPPSSGWGYSSLSLTTGDYINPEDFFTSTQFCLAN